MQIVNLKQIAGDWVEEIVAQYPFQPYAWMRQVDKASQERLMRQQLSQYCVEETAVILGAFVDTKLCGFVVMKLLPWDTNHFDLSVWRLAHFGVWGDPSDQQEVACALAHKTIANARYYGIQTIHMWVSLDSIPVIHALEAVGFRTMESQVYWLFDLHRQSLPEPQTDALFRPHTPDDVDALVALARRVYSPIPNRFYADPHLPTEACDDLYAEWLRNSCTGEAADYISVIELDGTVAGYATLRYQGNHGGLCNVRIGQFLLGAIDPAFRQKGLHDDLMGSLLLWLTEQHADVAFVGTQTNNAAAQAGMVRMGWRPVSSNLAMHCWLDHN